MFFNSFFADISFTLSYLWLVAAVEGLHLWRLVTQIFPVPDSDRRGSNSPVEYSWPDRSQHQFDRDARWHVLQIARGPGP